MEDYEEDLMKMEIPQSPYNLFPSKPPLSGMEQELFDIFTQASGVPETPQSRSSSPIPSTPSMGLEFPISNPDGPPFAPLSSSRSRVYSDGSTSSLPSFDPFASQTSPFLSLSLSQPQLAPPLLSSPASLPASLNTSQQLLPPPLVTPMQSQVPTGGGMTRRAASYPRLHNLKRTAPVSQAPTRRKRTVERSLPNSPKSNRRGGGGGGKGVSEASGGGSGGGEEDDEDEDEDELAHLDDVSSPSSLTPRNPSPRVDYTAPYYNNKQSDGTTTREGGGGGEKDRAKKRLARKAELARASRRRKKLYVQDLENKVKTLAKKVEELQQKEAKAQARHIPVHVTQEQKKRRERQQGIRKQLDELVKRKTHDKESMEKAAQLVRRFALNSRERQAAADFYLDRVQECLMPGLQVKFALWGLTQTDDFYTQAGGLWHSLMSKEVGLTTEQMESLKDKRLAMRKERQALHVSENLLNQLRSNINQHLQSLNHLMDDVQKIMSPLQLAKFHMWVENNEWCMQMLNTLFVQGNNPAPSVPSLTSPPPSISATSLPSLSSLPSLPSLTPQPSLSSLSIQSPSSSSSSSSSSAMTIGMGGAPSMLSFPTPLSSHPIMGRTFEEFS